MKQNYKLEQSNKRVSALREENALLKNKIKILEIENEKLCKECDKLYESIAEVTELEVRYNNEIEKLKKLRNEYEKLIKSYAELKNSYEKAMDKFLDTLK